jgi:hypothetical protein
MTTLATAGGIALVAAGDDSAVVPRHRPATNAGPAGSPNTLITMRKGRPAIWRLRPRGRARCATCQSHQTRGEPWRLQSSSQPLLPTKMGKEMVLGVDHLGFGTTVSASWPGARHGLRSEKL